MTYRIQLPVHDADWEAYFDLRWRILREPWQQPRGSEQDEDEASAFHAMVVDAKGTVVGVGRLHQVDDQIAQIRYMAVDPLHRQKGIGKSILLQLERTAINWGSHKVILHAREGVVEFYLKQGYRIAGPSHTLYGQIVHLLMEKSLQE